MNSYYGRKLNRLQGYDYASDGLYFVTFCVKSRENVLSSTNNDFLILTDWGKIVSDCYYDLPNHYENCVIHEFIIMPNHVHSIIEINNSNIKFHDLNTFGKHGLSEMIRAWKSFSTRRINEISDIYFQWQASFYDHIIQNHTEYEAIKKYISNNPVNWKNDRFFE